MNQPVQRKCASCGANKGFSLRLRVPNRIDRLFPLNVVTCNTCGLCFLNPQYPSAVYEQFYTETYFTDLKGRTLDEAREIVTKSYRRDFFEFFKLFLKDVPSGGQFIDIGAGSGMWLGFLFEACPGINAKNIHALEPSTAACDNIAKRFPGIHIQQAMLESATYPSSQFDAVLCSALIEHLTDPLYSLSNLNQITRLNGRVMLLTPSLDNRSLINGPAAFFKFVHTYYYTRNTLTSLLLKSGFEVEHFDYKPGIPGDPVWHPTLLVIAKKIAICEPSSIEHYRKPIELDKVGSMEASKIFSHYRWEILLHNLKFSIKSALGNSILGKLRRK